MAKFNIEVELDWMDEEAYSIDDELRERIGEGRGKRPSGKGKRRNVPSVWQKNPVGADEVRKEYAGRHGTA